MKNHAKIFQFITFHTKVEMILSLNILDSIKQMDLLELMIEIDIQYYLEVKNMIKFTTGLDI